MTKTQSGVSRYFVEDTACGEDKQLQRTAKCIGYDLFRNRVENL